MPLGGGGEQPGQAPVGVRPGHDIDLARLQKSFSQALGHAAEDAHDHVRPRLAVHVELLDPAPDPLLGIVAHGAGVGHNHVGLADVFRPGVTLFPEDGEDHLGVRHVHLAAVCLDIDLFHNAVQR